MNKVNISGANIVILANYHTPSIVSRDWAIEKGIITEEPIINFIHTTNFSVIETNSISLIVDPVRLQILAKNVNAIDKLPKIAEIYVRNLQELQYTAIGFNFVYHIMDSPIENIIQPSEKLKENLKEFKLGAIIVFNYEKFIVNMSLKPIDNKIEVLCNFHSNVKNYEDILDRLNYYNNAKELLNNILERLFV